MDFFLSVFLVVWDGYRAQRREFFLYFPTDGKY